MSGKRRREEGDRSSKCVCASHLPIALPHIYLSPAGRFHVPANASSQKLSSSKATRNSFFSGSQHRYDARAASGIVCAHPTMLIHSGLQFDASLLHGLTIPLAGGLVTGGSRNMAIEVDNCLEAQMPTVFIPGGGSGLVLPLDQRVHHALTLTLGSEEDPAAAAPAVALLPRPRVEQLGALRYKLQPLGRGSAPIPPRAPIGDDLRQPVQRKKRAKDTKKPVAAC